MSTAPLEQAIAATRSVLANVTNDQLSASTPCKDWDVRGLINHVIGAQDFFTAAMQGRAPAGADTDHAAGDFLAAYDQATAVTLGEFAADGALAKTVSLPFGDMPGGAVMGLAVVDTLTHGWDVAKATGQDTNIAPELSVQVLAQARQMIQPGFRTPEGSVFGLEQAAPDGACNADQLAAFLGRTV